MHWIIAFLVSGILGAFIGRSLVPFLKRLKFGQSIREEGPQSHLQKQGTPTMGGLLFFLSMPLALVLSWSISKESLFLLGTAYLFGMIGLLDDGLKIIWHQNLGLRAWQKIVLQLICAVLVLLWATKGLGLEPAFWIPKTTIIFGSGFFYLFLMFFVLLGTTNAANLTDGLDGLLASVTLVIAIGYFFIGLFLRIPTAMVFAAALAGTMIAFLIFNRHPAAVFMGDTGSFFIGGAVVGLAILTKTELLLPLICIVYVLEALSVIVQVAVFKRTGRRVFRMSPLHHHFELCGYKEVQVVRIFAMVALLAVVLSLLVVKGSDLTTLQLLRG